MTFTRTTYVLFALLFVLGFIAAEMVITPSFGSFAAHGNLARYADEVIERCVDSDYKPTCYDEEIPKVMDFVTMEDAFEVTRIIQEKDQGYFYCHVLGHNLSAREASKDISKWTEVVGRCPLGMCSNGCIHGTFQERFRDVESLNEDEVKAIMPDLKAICQDSDSRTFTSLERASCYHALGHLTMYITGADVDRSVTLCNDIANDRLVGFRDVCYDGAYMQIFQPLEPEDIALVAHIPAETREDAQRLCAQYSGRMFESCLRESWPLYQDSIVASAMGTAELCEQSRSNRQKSRCYLGLMYIMAPRLDFEPQRVSDYCADMPEEHKALCFGAAASRFVETDYRLASRAAELCELGEQYGVRDRCLEELLFYSIYNYHPGSEEFVAFCETLPSPWDQRCINEEGRSIYPFGSTAEANQSS